MLHRLLDIPADPHETPSESIPHDLYLEVPEDGGAAHLNTYFIDVLDQVDPNQVRPVVIILPGGAYQRLSAREAEPIAVQFVARGFHACVLHYSCFPATYPQSLVEVARCVAFLRAQAATYHIDPDRIILCGFSAGGHLACNLGTDWQQPWLAERVGVSSEDIRPNGLILGYPVITSSEFANRLSFVKLTGGDEKLAEELSLENHVTDHMPPTFVFHTLEDPEVPVENSLMLAQAMRRAHVSFTLHIFPYGPHGLSLATQDTARIATDGQVQPLMQCWPDLAAAWLKTL